MNGKLRTCFLVMMAVQANMAAAGKSQVSIDISVAVDGTCLAKIADQTFAVTSEAIRDRLPKLVPNRKTLLYLGGDYEKVPYRCVGPMIFGLQQLGYKSIGFAAEPPALESHIDIRDNSPQ